MPRSVYSPDTPYVPSGATQAGTDAAPTATTVWRFNAPADGTHGPFSLIVGGSLFQSTFDRVMYLGYNAADGGGTIVNSEPKFSLTFEADYDDSGTRTMEDYFEYGRASAVTLSDGVTTSGSPTVTSASTTFTTTNHVGRSISDGGVKIPANSYIGVVNSAHSIGLSSANNANTPVNALASGSGLTLSIVPSGPSQFRPIFMRTNRATGSLHFELNSTAGFSFNTTDGNQTNWGALSGDGLTVTGLSTSANNTGLTLAATASGKTTYISLGALVGGALLIQNYQSNVWAFQVGAGIGVKISNTAGMVVGDVTQSFQGVISGMAGGTAGDTTCFFAGVRTGGSGSAFIVRNVDTNNYMMSIEANGDIRSLATAGIHIGTTSTQKLGFFGVTPVVQQVRPTDAASIITAGTALGLWA